MKDDSPILLVEDDTVDQRMVQRALEAQGIPNPLWMAIDGDDALSALQEGVSKGERPGLILLDLNMPGIGGRECLKALKDDDRLGDIPVVVLTTSDEEVDLHDCYRLGASGYFVKPLLFEDFLDMVVTIHRYWSLCKGGRESA